MIKKRCAGGLVGASALMLALVPTGGAVALDTDPRAASASVTLLTCAIQTDSTFERTGHADQGLNYQTRDIGTEADTTTSGTCVDARTDKSATGGHSITKYSAHSAMSLANSTCTAFSGSGTVDVTWTLDNNTTVTSSRAVSVPLGNVLETIPSSGEVESGLFAGATVEAESLVSDLGLVQLSCLTSTGLRSMHVTSLLELVQ
ncbi:hypothetical protein [Streptomyces sp. NPDC088350]|uniref:hypothetical protein n=1 Tax=Streptomyces sp. NPDC088350 TaxID=3365854 RepID=UPI00382CC7AF